MKQKSLQADPTILTRAQVGLRLLVGAVLTYAGFSKAMGPVAEFAATIDFYQLFPTNLALNLASVLPWIELYTGLSLIFGYYLKVGVRLGTLIFGSFLGVLISALIRGLDPASCGCFGSGINLTVPQVLLIDSALFFVCVFLWKKPSRTYSLDQWLR